MTTQQYTVVHTAYRYSTAVVFRSIAQSESVRMARILLLLYSYGPMEMMRQPSNTTAVCTTWSSTAAAVAVADTIINLNEWKILKDTTTLLPGRYFVLFIRIHYLQSYEQQYVVSHTDSSRPAGTYNRIEQN